MAAVLSRSTLETPVPPPAPVVVQTLVLQACRQPVSGDTGCVEPTAAGAQFAWVVSPVRPVVYAAQSRAFVMFLSTSMSPFGLMPTTQNPSFGLS